jgi:hypothetical protein
MSAQNKAQRVAGRGRVREPPRRQWIDIAANFADYHADGAATQSFLHCPQHIAGTASCDDDQRLWSNARLIETRGVERAILRDRESFNDPEHDLFGGRTLALSQIPRDAL